MTTTTRRVQVGKLKPGSPVTFEVGDCHFNGTVEEVDEDRVCVFTEALIRFWLTSESLVWRRSPD
jgi:hypothetical protein